MLKVAGREEEGWLDIEDIDNFPCEDLRTIDQLWVEYSNGRFGFSVQKRIYQSLGGTREYDIEVWKAFCDKVGWRNKMDYINLRNLLAAKKWREADEETARVMLKVAGREEEEWLDIESIEKFPCEDLRTVDQLWVKYSNGRFGFSVQKRIYQSLGGTREYEIDVWKAFCDKVGWRNKNKGWLYYNDLTFSETAVQAHLPRLFWDGWVGYGFGQDARQISSLTSRLVDCNI